MIDWVSRSNVGKRRLMHTSASVTALLLMLGFASAAQAQSEQVSPADSADGPVAVSQPAAAPEEPTAQDIVVTGSRIRRPDLESDSPVNVLSSEALERKGTVNVQDAVNELPQLGIGQGNKTQNFDTLNSGYGTGGDYLNLRNLGTQRTLVVVNGRRFIGGDPGTSAVDLNTIPSIMVDRVDVVTGAASAVYGADAVSGVVNVILRNDFEGAMLTGHYGISKYGDASEREIGGIIGGKFDDGRGGALVAVEHTEQAGFLGGDRPFGQTDTNNFSRDILAGSTAIPGLVITNNGNKFSYNSAGNLVLNSTLTPAESHYQRLPLRTLSLPVKRTNVAAAAHYDLIEPGNGFSATIYTEDMYARSSNFLQYEDRAVFFQGSPRLFTPLDSSLNNIKVPANNPYAQALVPTIGPIPADGLSLIGRLTALGQNAATIDRETYRIVGGIRGDLTQAFTYDIYYQYGHLSIDQRDVNAFSRTKLAQTLNVDDNGTPGNFADDVCADATARAQGCVPFNFLTQPQQGINQPVKNYVGINSGVKTDTSQEVVSGFVSGNLFTLPAGAVALVLGGEYRKETAEIVADQSYIDFTSSLRFQNGLPKSSFDVKEAFGEISVPLLRDLPFVRKLEVGGAARYSDYSTVGNEFSWSVRGDWEVARFLRLRGVYATAVRAPNLNELYAPNTAVISTLQDPCDTVAENGTSTAPTGTRAASCATDLGAAAGTFNQSQIQSQSVVAVTGGNGSLDAEKAKTYTLGAVISPSGWLSGFNATVDYYNIKIDNVISQLSLQDTVNQCYDQASRPAQFCSLITRDATTQQLVAVTNNTFNAATESVAGLDTQITYQTRLDRLSNAIPGSVSFTAGWSRLFKHDFTARPGATVDHRKGQVGDFQDRFNLGALYGIDAFSFSWEGRIYGSALADTTITSSSPYFGPNHIGSFMYNDFQGTVDLKDSGFSFSLGIKNAFDVEPPVITTPARTVTGVQPTVTSIYDIRGRFFYSTVSLKF